MDLFDWSADYGEIQDLDEDPEDRPEVNTTISGEAEIRAKWSEPSRS